MPEKLPDDQLLKKVKHDWKTLLNGQTWKMVSGVDYFCTSSSMAATLRTTARKHGCHITMRTVPDGIILRATKKVVSE